MQVTVTSAEGLQRELKVVIGAGELAERYTTRLNELKGTVRLNGFRPGKVPIDHLRKVFGRSIMAEVVEQAIDDTSRKALDERDERPAQRPELKLVEAETDMERVIAGHGDIVYSLAFEALPKIEPIDFAGLGLSREVAEVEAAHVEEGIVRLVERNIEYVAEADRAAQTSDRVTIDFVGRIDGEEFEGGKAEAAPIVLGQGGFIPGFEDGLIGAKAGEDRLVRAKFPDDYSAANLAGKEAAFEVSVKEVARANRPTVDDELAKSFGADSLDKLREMVGQQIKREYEGIAREKLKRELLERLDKAYDIALPKTLVDGELEQIWQQTKDGLERAGKTLESEGKTEDEARAEHRTIAERRVRLGLILAAIGEQNKVQVTQDELRRALIQEARNYPGSEKFVYEYFEKTAGAVDQLRGPIYENKVVDVIIDMAKPAERFVTRDELFKNPDATAATA